MDQAVRFIPYSSSFLVCLAPLQPTPVAPGTGARSALRFFLIALRKAHRTAVPVPPQSSRATPFANPAKNFAVPRKSTFLQFGSNQLRVFVPKHSRAEKEKTYMNLNQLSIIGFIGKNAETKYLPNGTPVTKFSVATKKSWKDENDEWKEKTQWHNVAAFGKGFEQLADRLVKGAHVFVQGELTTREYPRTIKISSGKGKSIEHTIQQLVVELKADTIRTLDRSSSNGEQSDAAEPAAEGNK
jgi:single-strand DNA-binding protein